MNRNFIKICCTLVAALMFAGASAPTFADDDTTKRTLTGAGIGGAITGIATGSWGWAAAGAVVGGTGGYLYDKSKKNEEKAYDKGVKDGQGSKPK